jgi:hypothetical protein
MQFLDVRRVQSIQSLVEKVPEGPLPPVLREKGVFPDQSQMQIGDLVLISPHEPKFLQKRTQKYQKKATTTITLNGRMSQCMWVRVLCVRQQLRG